MELFSPNSLGILNHLWELPLARSGEKNESRREAREVAKVGKIGGEEKGANPAGQKKGGEEKTACTEKRQRGEMSRALDLLEKLARGEGGENEHRIMWGATSLRKT